MDIIYMDNAATSYPKPLEVYQAADYYMRNIKGNPGRGSNQESLKASSVVLEAREAVAKLFAIQDSLQIAFTLNVTEAINTALRAFLKAGDHVITSSMEHNSIARPLYQMEKAGLKWTRVACDQAGYLDPEAVRQAIKPNTKMISMLHVSNLTGTIMPIAEIGKIAREYGVLFLVDAAQSAGVLPINVESDMIDILCFTGHKSLLGPQGTGGIYLRKGLEIKPLKYGGTGSFSEFLEQPEFMPDLLESGTLNTPGIAGLLAGVEFVLEQGIDKIHQSESNNLAKLQEALQSISAVEIYGPSNLADKTSVLALNLKDLDCGELSMRLDHEYQIISRSGLHCAPLAHQSIGTYHRGACRLSPGFFSTEQEIEQVLKAFYEISKNL